MEYKRKRGEEPPIYTVAEPAALLPFLLAALKGKSRNNVKSLLSRRLVAVDGVPVSRPAGVYPVRLRSEGRSPALPHPL